jgi:hypothetical protein
MNDLLKKIETSIKWKKSAKWCAKKLGIPVKRYIELKGIYHERKRKAAQKNSETFENSTVLLDCNSGYNIEKGEGKLTVNCQHEPKNSDEIIKLLKLDTTKWKLSQYWNKQMSDHWRISALVTRVKFSEQAIFKNLLENWNPKKIKVPQRIKRDLNKPHVGGILSLQDIHFGKEGNETVDKDFEDTIIDLINRAIGGHHLSEIFFVVGGDLINMDTFNGTTKSGTILSNGMTATEAYTQAFDALYWGINYIKTHCDKLTVVYIPGNHDRLSSFHLAHALSKTIIDENIVWDVDYSERKVHVWNKNFNAFEHGDVPNKNTPLIYATEYPIEWGSTSNRTLYTGHFHHQKKIEYITKGETVGFIHKVLPSLSKTDYWHYHKKFVGSRRSGILDLQDSEKGTICELIHLVK